MLKTETEVERKPENLLLLPISGAPVWLVAVHTAEQQRPLRPKAGEYSEKKSDVYNKREEVS